MNKKILKCGILLATCLLCACHKNPLTTHKERHSTRFLINASAAAAQKLNPEMDARVAQYVYLSCMKGKESVVNCPALYKTMPELAQTTPFAAFKGIRVADLTDETVFDSLREGYEERLFYNNLED